MKKLLPILIILALAIVSCGESAQDNDLSTSGENDQKEVSSSQEDESSDTTSNSLSVVIDLPETSSDVPSEGYECVLDNGAALTIGSSADEAIKALTDLLGEAIDFMEAPSCVHPGNDKVYTFDGFTVTTSPDANGDEYVSELSFLSDAVGFENGIMIGSLESDVTSSFGSDFEEKFGVRKYSLSGAVLTITFTDDAVSALSVSAE